MKKVYLEYNPFLVETKITINGQPASKGGELDSMSNVRLQSWIDKLFPILVRKECNDSIRLTFKGTELDYNDVLAAATDYNNANADLKVTLEAPLLVRDGKDRLQNLKHLFKEMQRDCPFDDLRSADLKDKFERAVSTDFEINVIATMSSGKSTLINAFLGRELMPSKAAACTATIAHIKDFDEMDHFTAQCKEHNGKIIYTDNNLTAEAMARYNDDDEVSDIYIAGDIPFIASDNMQLVLVDTPGPNNSQNEEHHKRTYRVIKDDKRMPMVLYIMNATQLFTNDDNFLIQAVAEAVKSQHGKQAKDRFIFVINKADDLDPEKGDSIKKAIDDAQRYLKKHGIDQANIYPISANIAKVIRMHKNGFPLSKQQRMTLNNCTLLFDDPRMHLEKYAPLSTAVKQKLRVQLEQARAEGDEYAEALVHTGVPAVEAAIVEYMEKYSITDKIKDAVDTFLGKIQEKNLMSQLEQEWVSNDAERQRISQQWQKISAQFEQGKQAQAFRQKISELDITSEATQKIRMLRQKIDEEFDKNFVYRDDDEMIDPIDARKILHEMKQMIPPLQRTLQTDLEKIINDSIVNGAEKIMHEYKLQIQSLINEGEINVGSKEITVSADVLTTDLPDVSDFVEGFTETETKDVLVGYNVVSDSTWYKPWTWFDEHEEPIFEKQTYQVSDIKGIIYQYFTPLRRNMNDNVNKISNSAVKQAQEFKKFFIGELEKLDGVIQNKTKELASISSNRDRLNAKIKEDENKMDWLRKFQDKLDSTVNV